MEQGHCPCASQSCICCGRNAPSSGTTLLTGLHICLTESCYQKQRSCPSSWNSCMKSLTTCMGSQVSASWLAQTERHKVTCSSSSHSSLRLSSQMPRVSNPPLALIVSRVWWLYMVTWAFLQFPKFSDYDHKKPQVLAICAFSPVHSACRPIPKIIRELAQHPRSDGFAFGWFYLNLPQNLQNLSSRSLLNDNHHDLAPGNTHVRKSHANGI